MKNIGTKELHTERLLLRRFVVDDYKECFYNWGNDEEVTKYMTWDPYPTMESMRPTFEKWVELYESNKFYHWAIVYEENIVGDICAVHRNDNMYGIAYCLGKKWWGKGIMTEAARKVIEFVFDELEAVSVSGEHIVQNIGSGKVMIKCNMEFVETIKDEFTKHNKKYDLSHYILTKEDYLKYYKR